MTFFLQAADAAAAGQQKGGGMSLLIMMALIFLVMWLFMVRPQKKQQKELDDFRKALKNRLYIQRLVYFKSRRNKYYFRYSCHRTFRTHSLRPMDSDHIQHKVQQQRRQRSCLLYDRTRL